MESSKKYFAELAECTGDVGARGVLERHMEDVYHIPVEDEEIFRDIDTPEDFAQHRKQEKT